MEQKITSANTSINKNKLPYAVSKIDFNQYRNGKGLDYGGGKFDNLKQHLKDNYNIILYIYDKYNRSLEENTEALLQDVDFILCNNVLNVIQQEEVLQEIIEYIEHQNVPTYISVYEGNRSEIGRVTKKDCYQRNEKLSTYYNRFTRERSMNNGIITLK